jgi:hypothetical protein
LKKGVRFPDWNAAPAVIFLQEFAGAMIRTLLLIFPLWI